MTFRLNNEEFKKLQNIVEWQIEVYLSKKTKDLKDLKDLSSKLECKLNDIENVLRQKGLL